MKRKLLIILLIFTTVVCTSQIKKFRITSLTMKNYNDKLQKWDDWKELVDSDILGLIDPENNRIKMFFEEEQSFDVIENLGSTTDSDGDDIVEWVCINESGNKCGVKLVTLNSQDSRKQIYITFNNFIILYNIRLLD